MEENINVKLPKLVELNRRSKIEEFGYFDCTRLGVTYYPNRVEVSQTQSSAPAFAPIRVCGRGNRRLVGQRVVAHTVDTQVSLWLPIDCVYCVVIMCESSEPLKPSTRPGAVWRDTGMGAKLHSSGYVGVLRNDHGSR
ncbi:hypothetical protein Gogos_012802 [Gossypium gossypioides]|uniref:Uncharacterized protein n=1 Tax=Gossypium gossypioides TaxID=34282 RepID=A0A7J9BTL8_GOSGO|nr:hypothetical protein [Gossypium gossypioides]